MALVVTLVIKLKVNNYCRLVDNTMLYSLPVSQKNYIDV